MNNHRAWGSTHDETDINITGASILTNAHHVTINNPYFAAYHGHDTVPAVHDSHICNNEGDSYGSSKRKGTEPMHGTQKRRKFSPSESCYDLDEEDLSGVPKVSSGCNELLLRL
ncbi:hypothetical protein C8J55DRAFT_525054 [Lentinula edodes]|uniref:Uncharacterized protein n=1 Tax=Lentinula lateritia TaxID=40482 RepID=A0A9W8ZW78_9AGAR|nr:hypothetical protein C8J55DRAFT_525054 [Lentinula edodes]